jgi:hypothetical protein
MSTEGDFTEKKKTVALNCPLAFYQQWGEEFLLLGVFEIFRKTTVSFVMPICLSVRKEQLGY